MSLADCNNLRLPESAATVLRSPGNQLDPATRQFMEARFGRDLGDVRVHTDSAAARSAQGLSAQAYTVGTHIAFGPAAYAPHSATGRQRLAHEIAHALQQRQGGPDLVTAQREGEARRAARSVVSGAAVPPISAASPALSRDPAPDGDNDASFEATLAEGSCDIGALCRLSHRAPDVVTRERLLRAYRQCHPGVPVTRLVAGNPCLTPNFGLPPRVPAPAAGPRRGPGTGTPGAAPGPAAAGGGLELPSTEIRFNLGAAAFTVGLPPSLAVRLPVPFRGAERVVFSLNASTSEFSLRVTINAAPHLRIIASAGATTEGRGSAGLTVQTTRTSCQAVNPAAARSALQSAGTRLRDAILAVQNPPAPEPGASELETTFAPHARYAEVVGAVANLKSEIDRVGAPCREVPVASFEFGVQGPLTAPEETAGPGAPPASFIGGSLRLHF